MTTALRRTRVAIAAGAVLAAAALFQSVPAQSVAPAPAAVGPLTWSDDFDGPAGAAPDGSKWKHDIGGSGWGNNELEYYTDSTSNAALDGSGNLVITARRDNPADYQCHYGRCEYTSARLLTADKFTQTYGRFEARLKIPRGQGIWPAFWMLGNDIGTAGWPNSGEIDIMENIGREPANVYGTLHGPGYSGGAGLTSRYTNPGGAPFADAFHTFTVDWEPNAISWSVDGVQYARKTSADTNGNRWVFDHPFFMILNVAVGGAWPGNPDGSTTFPQTMTVDYVHVYGQGGGTGGGSAGAIRGLANKCLDVYAANPADGTQVDLYDCNGTGAQQWTRPGDGTIRALGKCLDVNAGSTADGAKVQLWTCNGTGAQQWVYSSGRDLVNTQANKCLDVTGNNSANYTPVQLWTCTGGANQKWTV